MTSEALKEAFQTARSFLACPHCTAKGSMVLNGHNGQGRMAKCTACLKKTTGGTLKQLVTAFTSPNHT